MAWGAAATGTPAATGSTGPGPVADAGVARRDVAARASRSSCSTWPAPRATTGRPPAAAATATTGIPVLAPMDVPEAVELTQLAFHLAAALAQPGAWSSATTTSRTPRSRWRSSRVDFGALPADRLGARRLHRRHRQRPVRVAARHRQAARRPWATTSRSTTPRARDATEEMLEGIEPLVDDGRSSTTPRSSSSRSARPGRYVRAAVREPAGRRRQGRLGAPDHAGAVPDRRGRRPRPTVRGPSPSTRTTRAR